MACGELAELLLLMLGFALPLRLAFFAQRRGGAEFYPGRPFTRTSLQEGGRDARGSSEFNTWIL